MASVFKRPGEGRNYWIQFTDHTGKRRLISSGTHRKKEALAVADSIEVRELRYKAKLDSPEAAEKREHSKTAIEAHIYEYEWECKALGQAPRHVIQKLRHLQQLAQECGASRLEDIDKRILQRNMLQMRTKGLSARTCNFRRQIAVAFYNWCLKSGRLDNHDLMHCSKHKEDLDRRRVRRAITDAELDRLFAVAKERGRLLWYMLAAYTGLRRGEMARLDWGDVDLESGAVRIFNRKANKQEWVPVPEPALSKLRESALKQARGPVFPTLPTFLTRQKDFERAGIGPDESGRVADLHAMRTTLGTRLAQKGVPPQIAQKVMRHADYRTTLKHYTQLGMDDVRDALEEVMGSPAPKKVLKGPGSERRREV